MRPSRFVSLVVLVACSLTIASVAVGQDRNKPSAPVRSLTFASFVKPFLSSHCLGCHGQENPAGGIVLSQLSNVEVKNAAIWKRIWEQVSLGQMPPKDDPKRPSSRERLQLSTWITRQLELALAEQGGFDLHRHPAKGNHLDHRLLFGPIPPGLTPPSTPARIWRIHPQEHLVRLSALINREPEYDPQRPGLRAHGDWIPPNQDGQIKVYYGLNRLIGWVGGTVAFDNAITGFPAMLSTDNSRGLRSYAHLYSVNAAEATQIAQNAENILRFMAFGPDAEPYQFADSVAQVDKKYKHESVRGLSQSLFYSKTPNRPMTPIADLLKASNPSDKLMSAAIQHLFEALTGRPPVASETHDYLEVLKESIQDLGVKRGAILGLTPIFLDREALFRLELAEAGTPDQHGRVMLQGHELALAINAAFCYLGPDRQLKQALADGKLKTRADVRREVTRILGDERIRKPRILQFFREYFDYDRAGHICKDTKALRAAGGNTLGNKHYQAMFAMEASTDRLIEEILSDDKRVLRRLLTTNYVVYDRSNDERYLGEFRPRGKRVNVRLAQVIRKPKPERVLLKIPNGQRLGILTQPSWLVSHSDAMDNHAIRRGLWIRQRLLGGAVPDVPITVNAMLPDEPRKTLRDRMRVTRKEDCWKCHRKMDPLGLPFEMFNHVGRYRTKELRKPVVTTGAIIDSGDASLDGPVKDAFELIRKLADSDRVHQVFVRHAFRFWLGRNETINDAPVLQEAYQVYRNSDGSMKELLISLLSSDAFLYRSVARRR